MKKALVVLGMVAFASVAFAKAPLISGVPDIVIGDAGTDQTATYDNNWFRYPNAFNILTYAQDVDSPASDLFFTFLEPTAANDINIIIDAVTPNVAKSQVPAADATNPSAWGTHEITNYGQATRDYLVSFLDMVRSNPANQIGNGVTAAMFANPRRADGTEVVDPTVEDLPWHNNPANLTQLTGASRNINLYVADDPTAADATRIGSDVMTVISRNYANDAVSGGLNTQWSFQFSSGPGSTWTFQTFPGIGAAQVTSGSGTPNGFVGMTVATATGAGGVNYGRWLTQRTGYANFQGLIPYVAGNVVYAARYTMSHNVDTSVNRGFVPQLRLGVNGIGNPVIISSLVGALANAGVEYNPHIPAQNAPVMYKIPWSTNDGSPYFQQRNFEYSPGNFVDLRTFDAYFDVMDDQATQGGTWTLHNFDVVTTPRPASLPTADAVYGVGGTTNFTTGWASGGSQSSGGRSITTTQNADGSLQVNDPGIPTGSATANFLLWQTTLGSAVTWQGGTMIRTTLRMSCPDETARTNFHKLRLRQLPVANQWWATEWALQGDNGLENAYLPNNPMMPPVGAGNAFNYEAYASSQVPDDSLMTTLHSQSLDSIRVGLDFISLGVDPGAAKTYDLATTYTIHTLSFEVLDENI